MTLTMQRTLAALLLLAAARPAFAADASDDSDAAGDEAKKTPEATPPPPSPEGGDPCIDEDVKADLFAKRRLTRHLSPGRCASTGKTLTPVVSCTTPTT